ncbi:hypothetical protein PCANC_16068 [Puccinia coronata f. sp. avenae]|uniref:UBA domain-containing protein n=1 Tax=Puccinia coronata f. sp. avenae TaxID=200324 RepID=A0A2N5T4W5_9BASI|nr:hypothetical protein PCANC_19900 [Puccinia coronata f. sp. avenae]PLW20526.1 hypothetical protein PCASD_15559 [Puccinia coronata f. sp. avenae]PLW34611.1 hypothetical protein PCANC_16068 [Puccinia coronata f. sp. avenae]PLW45040.1 hypothetical protein PCASD_06966 [Puccinia coronata f. sp. avenae]
MASELLTTLTELGFEPSRAERALKATGGRSVDEALDWLEKNEDLPAEEDDKKQEEGNNNGPVPHAKASTPNHNEKKGEMAKGLKCADCGKFFKNNPLASYHSEKSGHINFDEVEYEDKPLTEEEKQARLDRLREQLKERQLAKKKVEENERKVNEVIRRKGGKDMSAIKEEMKKKEMEKEIAQRKKDKLEDEMAKARARAAIAEDKEARARKAAFERSKRLGIPPQPEKAAKAPAAQKRMSPTGAKEYTEGRFQLRLPTAEGTVVVVTLEAHKTLADLAMAVAAHPDFLTHESRPSSCLRFSTTYPRKLFSHDEMRKSIKELGLLPSVALAVSYV